MLSPILVNTNQQKETLKVAHFAFIIVDQFINN